MMTVKVGILQHTPGEPAGYLETILRDGGIPCEYHYLFESGELPPVDAFSHVVILGGPMSVNDEREYPYLSAEKGFIRRCVAQGRAVFGICLGAQLIACAFGAGVYRFREEIGWGSVRWSGSIRPPALAEECSVFQFHGDTFDIPPEGILLATGTSVPHQALAVGSAVGFQFHVEMTEPLIRDWIKDRTADEQHRILGDTTRLLPESNRVCREIAAAFLRASGRDPRTWFR